MPLRRSDKPPSNRSAQSETRRRRLTAGRKALVLIVSIVVAALIAASLWISVAAVVEKVRVANGMRQIIDIVDMSRQLAITQHDLGAVDREDLLARLARTGRIKLAGDSGGLMTVSNPWDGSIVAFASSRNSMHLESVVPSRVCERIVELLAKDIESLGLRQIDVKGWKESWRQIYSESGHGRVGAIEISAGCQSDVQVVLALTFALR
jgi:hypothetical protein